MNDIIRLDFTKLLTNFITDEEVKDQDFGRIMDAIFDRIPLKSNKNFSLYNDIVISIRKARRNNEEYIDIPKTDLELLKTILIEATQQSPDLNRAVSFLTEVIDNTIEDYIKSKDNSSSHSSIPELSSTPQ